MEARHIEELRQKHRYIVDNIGDTEAVCDELLSLGILDESYIEKILLKKPAPKAQTKELLYLLKFRGAKAYGKFITALLHSKNKHVADELMKPDPEPQELTQPESDHIHRQPVQPESLGHIQQETSLQPEAAENRPIQVQSSLNLPSLNQPSLRQPSLNQSSVNQSSLNQSSVNQSSLNQQSSVNQSSLNQPVTQPTPAEDVFKSWPEKKCTPRICTEEEKRPLLSDPTVYKITEFHEKGFVVRSKCYPKPITTVPKNFDTCNSSLDHLMVFLDSKIRSGPCFAKLFNRSAADFKKNIREMIDGNTVELNKAGYFMMFLLSYGPVGAGCGLVFDRENKLVKLDNIIKMVTQCEALKDKPKIFIVITIPDECATVPEPPGGRTEADAGADYSPTNEDDVFVFHVYHGQHGTWIKDTPEMWFMRAFQDVVHAYSYNLHLLELMEKVNQLLSNAVVDSQTKARGHVGEIKVINKDIRKKLYFFPGIECQPSQQPTS